MVKNIQNRLDVEGLMVNVALLGGRQVILVDNSEGGLEELLNQNRELVKLWFEWIQPSSLSTMSSPSRLVWLRFNGVPLKAWSERCFTELGSLMGEVILVDEDTRSKSFLCEGRVLILSAEKNKISTTICLRVDEEDFQVAVSEEEWRMDPDWWLAGERRNPANEPSSESSSSEDEDGVDGYSDLNLNLNGNDFLCKNDVELVKDLMEEGCDVTVQDSNGGLGRKEGVNEKEAVGISGLDGLEGVGLTEDGLDRGNRGTLGLCGLDGLEEVGLEEAGPNRGKWSGLGDVNEAGGSAVVWLACGPTAKNQEASTRLQQLELTERKCRNLKEIYAGDKGADEVRGKGVSWITARTKKRSQRKTAPTHSEEEPNLQQESSLVTDGYIQHRNGIIRQQLEINEVKDLFMMGQRLGIQCQNNEEEVMSRLAALEKRDEENFRGC
ncbi:hypothetical protein SLA2020_505430 [Shorea laevis]